MDFNFTDDKLYVIANTAINFGLFLALVLPTLVLCVFCVIALALAKDMILQMKILLINIFGAEICNWLSFAVVLVTFLNRVRLSVDDPADPVCRLAGSLFVISPLQKSTSL